VGTAVRVIHCAPVGPVTSIYRRSVVAGTGSGSRIRASGPKECLSLKNHQAVRTPDLENQSPNPEGGPVSDLTSVALHTALNGLQARQRAIADNISNINTPKYLANKVQFESELKSAIASGSASSAAVSEISTKKSLEPTREDGNNVNLDEETISNISTNLSYQTVLSALNSKYSMLRTAMSSQ
jgi:flagellar basal-body rod protein FlgB